MQEVATRRVGEGEQVWERKWISDESSEAENEETTDDGAEEISKDPLDRTCAKICINYEPSGRRLRSATSRSTGRPGVLQFARPPESDEEDSRVPRAVFWDLYQVGLWITSLGFPQYKQCFEANHISGQQLILLNGNSLPQMGITIHNHIKIILKNVHQLLGITAANSRKSIVETPREEIALYLEKKSFRGEKSSKLTFEKFLHETQDRIWEPQHLANFAFMAPPEQRIKVPALRK